MPLSCSPGSRWSSTSTRTPSRSGSSCFSSKTKDPVSGACGQGGCCPGVGPAVLGLGGGLGSVGRRWARGRGQWPLSSDPRHLPPAGDETATCRALLETGWAVAIWPPGLLPVALPTHPTLTLGSPRPLGVAPPLPAGSVHCLPSGVLGSQTLPWGQGGAWRSCPRVPACGCGPHTPTPPAQGGSGLGMPFRDCSAQGVQGAGSCWLETLPQPWPRGPDAPTWSPQA